MKFQRGVKAQAYSVNIVAGLSVQTLLGAILGVTEFLGGGCRIIMGTCARVESPFPTSKLRRDGKCP